MKGLFCSAYEQSEFPKCPLPHFSLFQKWTIKSEKYDSLVVSIVSALELFHPRLIIDKQNLGAVPTKGTSDLKKVEHEKNTNFRKKV